MPSGSYTVTASFAGAPALLPSSASSPYTVKLEETHLVYTGTTLIANGSPATLSGTLTEDGVTPIAGRTVSFALGSGGSVQSCSGTTDASGSASCTIGSVNQPLGPGLPIAAQFAGDVDYQPASATATALVYANLANGAFVIGDLEAVLDGAVTFWGSQWRQDNAMSGGPAPAAFKGFADTTSSIPPVCGGSWTTDPGNSAPPPDSVPSYMGVLVSSAISKSGSTISGNDPTIVVVRTDPGYAPAPGHRGTGTVVAVVCHP
jgi:hypothetical protein